MPNALTAARMGMALLAAVLFLAMGPHLFPILICMAASLLDFWDGWIARRTGQVSRLGEHLDPLADKILVTVIFLALAFFLRQPWVWVLVTLLLLREWSVTWLRERLQQRHRLTLSAGRLGKWKMLAQSLFGNGFLAWLSLSGRHEPLDSAYLPTLVAALALILLLSYVSAARYIMRASRQDRLQGS